MLIDKLHEAYITDLFFIIICLDYMIQIFCW